MPGQPCSEKMAGDIIEILKTQGIFAIVTGATKKAIDTSIIEPLEELIAKDGLDRNIFKTLLLLPCNGTQMFAFDRQTGNFEQAYLYSLENVIGKEKMAKLIGKPDERQNSNRECILTDALKEYDWPLLEGDVQIENRGSQVTLFRGRS